VRICSFDEIFVFFRYKLEKASLFETDKTIKFNIGKNTANESLKIPELNQEAIDHVFVLNVKK